MRKIFSKAKKLFIATTAVMYVVKELINIMRLN